MTSTEIDTTPPLTAILASQDAPAAVNQLMAHAQAMKTAYDLANAMCASELVPAIYRGKPDNGAAAILYGLELGLNPIQSLQQIFVVHGSPAIYARTMVALVKSKGHEVWTAETSDRSVTVRGRRRGEQNIEEATWSIERAKLAGFTSNKKYQTEPQAMLYAKAAAEVCRKMAPDVLLGIAHTREELELEGARQAPAATGGGTRGVAGVRARLGLDAPAPRATAADPSGEPRGEEASAEDGEDKPAPATEPQVKRIAIGLRERLGLTGRDEILDWLSAQLHRPVGSRKELTAEEASWLIEWLDSQPLAEQAAASDGGADQ